MSKKGDKFLHFARKTGSPSVNVLAVPADATMLAFFRECVTAKPLRAAALHYTHTRETHGTDTTVTKDAELNAYRQALAFVEEVQRKISRKKEK